ncbi:MAG TPA: phosphoesterase, partial [Thermoanaerobaculia bacterium]|nr:phosphoesterase [Thermoanaerobaculia bacterium]
GARAALVTATAGGQHAFALGAGEGFGDVQALGREVAALLGGKGGGSGRVFQGKAPALDGADRAAARLAAT